MPRTTETMTVSLPPAMMRQVDHVCESEHRTRSELVREALRVYFAGLTAPSPEARAKTKLRRPGTSK